MLFQNFARVVIFVFIENKRVTCFVDCWLSGRLFLQTPSYVSIIEVSIYLWIAKTKLGTFF